MGFLGVSDVTVDADGVTARAPRETVMDMLVEGRRVYSFWLHRDGSRPGAGSAAAGGCPGRAPCRSSSTEPPRLTVVVHETGEQVFDEELSFGTGDDRINVVNAAAASS